MVYDFLLGGFWQRVDITHSIAAGWCRTLVEKPARKLGPCAGEGEAADGDRRLGVQPDLQSLEGSKTARAALHGCVEPAGGPGPGAEGRLHCPTAHPGGVRTETRCAVHKEELWIVFIFQFFSGSIFFMAVTAVFNVSIFVEVVS